ncbi:cell cycle checkpoint [Obba rivulosa]|uniref:Checkpoint protein n=1 Tax=Obba rivulosa TaxID=1052685 RepID=A0A8E2DGP4_9APHY|nr:cell cycle checkpoint [Obba rivulosa]
MRFRATVPNVNTFYKIAQTIEKLHKHMIIRFTESVMHIICNSAASEGGVQVWSQIEVPVLFTDYRIQSNADNEITFTVHSDVLAAALRSAASPSAPHASHDMDPTVIMRLAKKNEGAVLSFEITGVSRLNREIRVSHDVRIEVMRAHDVRKLSAPLCPNPDVNIILPPLTKLRTVVERIRPLAGEVIALYANGSGALKVSGRTDSARVDVAWSGLANPAMEPDSNSQGQTDDETNDPTKMYGVLVSLRSLSKFLGNHVVSTTTIASICQNHCLILYVYIGGGDAGGVITFYIPAIFDDPI